ncbi:MAG: tetratricopeptide repeat protein [Acidobacteria bacterium]|nr:tetratricopeptide repeat protein [Acidobacteriota bacterium]
MTIKKSTFPLLGLAFVAVIAPPPSNGAARGTPGASAPASAAPAFQGRNGITGMVFNEAGRPVAEVYVELLSDLDTTVSQVRTNASGRFEFRGLSEGRYNLRVRAFGTDYLPQVQEVILANVSATGGGTGGEVKQVDIYLRLRPEVTSGPFYAPGTVFAQDVPDEAKKLFEKGVSALREKKEAEAFESLKRALELFPNYYEALDRLGGEYAVRGGQDRRYFEAARVLLTKAVEVNPKSFSSTFGLGFSQYNLGLTKEAVETLQRAVGLYGKSPSAHLWLGIAQRREGQAAQAEASLKRADALSNGKEPDAHWQLANLYNEQKRYAEAAAELEKFLKARPDARDADKIKQMIVQLKQKAGATP